MGKTLLWFLVCVWLFASCPGRSWAFVSSLGNVHITYRCCKYTAGSTENQKSLQTSGFLTQWCFGLGFSSTSLTSLGERRNPVAGAASSALDPSALGRGWAGFAGVQNWVCHWLRSCRATVDGIILSSSWWALKIYISFSALRRCAS